MFKTMQYFSIFLLILSYLQFLVCNELDKTVEAQLFSLSSQVGSCSDYFEYLRHDFAIIGKLSLSNLKLGDTIKMEFYRSDYEFQKHFTGLFLPDESAQLVMAKLRTHQLITFRVDFPITQTVPSLKKIFINDKELCTTTFTATNKEFILQNTLEIINGSIAVYSNNNINIPHFTEGTTCGLVDTEIINDGIAPLIYGGTDIRRGEYPWLTAIYKKRRTGITFICGGSLVTSKIVLTAAHCIELLGLTARRIVVLLGRHNLTNYIEDSIVIRETESIIMHPEYKGGLGFSDADIALLNMKEDVSFTKFIKPICLWNEIADESLIVSHTGVVAGWGSDEDGNTISIVPKKVKTDIVSEVVCLRSSPAYAAITSSRTLCAGNRDGAGPCEGDSGGGLMINRNGLWMLRGVVSAGLILEQRCNLHDYAVYCDIAKHKSWLDSYVDQKEPPITGSLDAICGKSGTAPHSKHPWLAAVYRKVLTGEIFHCSGALISTRSILAPAHCILLGNNLLIRADYLRIYLGRYDVNDITENTVVTRDIATVISHPEYYAADGYFNDKDVIILQVKIPVIFTQYIKPICLWKDSTDNTQIIGQSATLLSYDRFGIVWNRSTVLQTLQVDIAPLRHCEEAGFNVSISSRILCTPRFGNVNAGGFLLLERNGRWLIRGISSYNAHYYFSYSERRFRLYADILDYLPWIESNMLL